MTRCKPEDHEFTYAYDDPTDINYEIWKCDHCTATERRRKTW